MNTDINGHSTCARGEESFERYFSALANAMRYQYDYRTVDGKLFSCITTTLECARAKRDAWLAQLEKVEVSA